MSWLGKKPADQVVSGQQLANGTVTYSKMQSVTAGRVLGRDTSGNGVVQELPIAVDTSGNVGIGTSSPLAKMHVYTGSITDTSLFVNNAYVGSTGGVQITQKSTGEGQLFTFNSQPLLLGTSNTERMRIAADGSLQMGTASIVGGAFVSIQKAFGGGSGIGINSTSGVSYAPIVFQNSGTQTGYISSSTTSVGYNTASDYRLKENIQPMQNALGVVTQLKPCTYTWKTDGSKGQGFIAHELQAVVPDCVTGEKDALDADGNPVYQGIDTSFLVATLTAAIQEQQAIIAQLQADVALLKGVTQ